MSPVLPARRLGRGLQEVRGERGQRRLRRLEVDEGDEEACFEAEDEVRLGQRGRRAHGDGLGNGFRPSGHGLSRQGAGLFDQLGEAGEVLELGEVLVLGNRIRIVKPEGNGGFKLVQRDFGISLVGEGAGEVVVPGRIAGERLDAGAADALHGLDVAAAQRADEFLAQLAVGGPEAWQRP